jgi:tRNA-splicing ligase RtcB
MSSINFSQLSRINDFCWEIPKCFRRDMRVPARFYSDETLLSSLIEDDSLDQLINVACLPGIQKAALGMPDMHQGYGFPIGGVAALDEKEGIISPGGIGYDINCGVRILISDLSFDEAEGHINKLLDELEKQVPAGLGKGGRIKLSAGETDRVLEEGVSWMIENGYGYEEDKEVMEAGGRMEEADSRVVSGQAKKRSKDQLGTLGSGNHFLEIDRIDEVMDKEAAEVFGLKKGQAVVLMHSGSRGLGHQVAGDHIRKMEKAMAGYNIRVPDRQLAGAPLSTPEGEEYFAAMAAAANFAWANRQALTWEAGSAWKKVFGKERKLSILYDVAHNIAKMEDHSLNGVKKRLLVERKGATRAFGPDSQEIPTRYKRVGQPVIIPGSMGTGSYVLAGNSQAEQETFGSVCHGAGRVMSRRQAARSTTVQEADQKLQTRGVQVRSASKKGLLEEIPAAYKDIHNVVDIVHRAGLARRVARLRPMAVIKG